MARGDRNSASGLAVGIWTVGRVRAGAGGQNVQSPANNNGRIMHNVCMLVELTNDELSIINKALNEVCNGIHLEGEFDIRMGCTVDEARAVLAKINTLASGQ